MSDFDTKTNTELFYIFRDKYERVMDPPQLVQVGLCQRPAPDNYVHTFLVPTIQYRHCQSKQSNQPRRRSLRTRTEDLLQLSIKSSLHIPYHTVLQMMCYGTEPKIILGGLPYSSANDVLRNRTKNHFGWFSFSTYHTIQF
jgi:hypothetical protein